jgi:hypothetical protein
MSMSQLRKLTIIHAIMIYCSIALPSTINPYTLGPAVSSIIQPYIPLQELALYRFLFTRPLLLLLTLHMDPQEYDTCGQRSRTWDCGLGCGDRRNQDQNWDGTEDPQHRDKDRPGGEMRIPPAPCFAFALTSRLFSSTCNTTRQRMFRLYPLLQLPVTIANSP